MTGFVQVTYSVLIDTALRMRFVCHYTLILRFIRRSATNHISVYGHSISSGCTQLNERTSDGFIQCARTTYDNSVGIFQNIPSND